VKHWRRLIGALTVVLGAGYLLVVGVLWANQKGYVYYPDKALSGFDPQALPGFGEHLLTTSDGERIVGWWRPPQSGEPVIVYFHGNGGNLAHRAPIFRTLAASGFGVLAIDYRGYGRSSGAPSEPGLYADADAAWRFVGAKAPGRPVVLWGESLGTAVAVQLASRVDEVGLMLDSPIASMTSMARRAAPYAPSFLVTERFESLSRIERVGSPVLIVHCDADTVVPIGEGRALFARAAAPKRFIELEGCGHTDIWREPEIARFMQVVRGWLTRDTGRPKPN
jgi:uncharacterized protein